MLVQRGSPAPLAAREVPQALPRAEIHDAKLEPPLRAIAPRPSGLVVGRLPLACRVPVSVGSVCRTSLTDVGALSFPVRRNDPSVAGVRAAHILNEPVPTADGEATVIVFVHDGVYPRVTGRDAGAHVGHHGRHQDVAGAFPRREGTPLAASAPLPRPLVASQESWCRCLPGG